MTEGGEKPAAESINGDLSVVAHMDSNRMQWTSSPSGKVWRKRLHLVGPPEAGQVTSIVRYEPGSTFPAHDHPDGEEIFVLDGVFSDEHGDWPAGTYLLNPEGFRHAPFSGPGCRIFVKLRQFPGRDREHHVIATDELAWQPTSIGGVSVRPLYSQHGFADTMHLARWDAGTDVGETHYEHGVEMFVLEGGFEDATGAFAAGAWIRLPPGASHHPCTERGCTLYVKLGGFDYLHAASGIA